MIQVGCHNGRDVGRSGTHMTGMAESLKLLSERNIFPMFFFFLGGGGCAVGHVGF